MAFAIRICYVCVFYLFLLCVTIRATTKRTAFSNDFNKIPNATDAIHSIYITINEIKPLIFNVKRKISHNDYNITEVINQFTNVTEIKQNSNLTMNYQPIENKLRLFVANVSLCAENHQTFCTKNDDYPLEYIQKLLYRLPPEYKRFFYGQAVPQKIIYPTSGTTHKGDGLFIFNTDDHKQGVHIEMCQNAGKPCDDFVILRNNYRSECKQQKSYRELLSLSPEGKPITERFEFPASCTCVLRRVKKNMIQNS